MPATFVRSSRLFPAAPYAYAAAAPGTGVIFTAGACPLDEQGHVVEPGDIAAHMRWAVANLQVTLKESGAKLSDVLKTTVYVCSARENLVAAWNVVAAAFGDHDAPRRCWASPPSAMRASSSRSKRSPSWTQRLAGRSESD